jgi:hypothetical protein
MTAQTTGRVVGRTPRSARVPLDPLIGTPASTKLRQRGKGMRR